MRKTKITTLILTLLIVCSAFGKDALVPVIKGRVVDEKGQPMPAAAVYIEGSIVGTTTDNDGSFFFNQIPSGKRHVTARFIGYKQQTLEAQVADGRPQARARKPYALGPVRGHDQTCCPGTCADHGSAFAAAR